MVRLAPDNRDPAAFACALLARAARYRREAPTLDRQHQRYALRAADVLEKWGEREAREAPFRGSMLPEWVRASGE